MSSESKAIPVMFGTAGHVDHGKTTLVRRLTNFDTDRLPEEKRRGMSIDMSVAPFEIPELGTAGIIDLPGHEDFINNMVAGASAVDFVMLVIAADDGVMPQTREHAGVLVSLGVDKFILVINKCDLVSNDESQLAAEEGSELLKSLGVEPVAIHYVSGESGAGVEALRADLESRAREFQRFVGQLAFRMPVRAAFTMKGHGTVVTGVPMSGTVSSGSTVELLPGGRQLTVRTIQTYRSISESTSAHISSALNIRDLDPKEIHRGSVLVEPGTFKSAETALCVLKNTQPGTVFKRRGDLRIHIGTFSGPCFYRLIDSDELAAGQESFAWLKFRQPVALAAGDRVLFRVLSPSANAGSGSIIGTSVGRMRALTPELVERFILASSALSGDDVVRSELFSRQRIVLRTSEILSITQAPAGAAQSRLEALEKEADLISLGYETWLFTPRLTELQQLVKRHVRRYHAMSRYSFGMKPAHLMELLRAPAEAFRRLEPYLLRDEELAIKSGRVALKDFAPQISAREAKLREQCLTLIAQAGAQAIARGDLQAKMGATDAEFKVSVRLLADEGLIVAVGKYYVTRELFEKYEEIVRGICKRKKVMELGEFREATGLSRNVATEVLDGFDSLGLTKRVPEGRVLQRK